MGENNRSIHHITVNDLMEAEMEVNKIFGGKPVLPPSVHGGHSPDCAPEGWSRSLQGQAASSEHLLEWFLLRQSHQMSDH